MNAMLGGGNQKEEEMAAFRPSHGGPQLVTRNNRVGPNARPDYSTMSAAEAAAILNQQTSEKVTAKHQQTTRYRTQRSMDHHALAQELSENLQVRLDQEKKAMKAEEHVHDEEEDEEFLALDKVVKRERAAPQIISRTDRSESSRRRRAYDDSSSSDDSRGDKRRGNRGQRPSRRRRDDSSDSSSDDDDAGDLRRKRLLQNRKRHEPEVVHPVGIIKPTEKEESPSTEKEEETPRKPSDQPREVESDQPTREIRQPPKTEIRRHRSNSNDSSSSGGSSGSSSSSSSSSGSSSDDSSSDEDEPVLAKPIFIPKSKRMLMKSDEKQWEEEEARVDREKLKAEKRKMESRALVAKSVAAVNDSTAFDEVEDEAGGATNPPPNDDDEVDAKKERHAWELRELERLLDAMDSRKKREEERLEYERRKNMTDEEVLQHDMKTGRYIAPGSSRMEQQTGNHLQKFFHRGAYYMAEDEWDNDDVRHKAAEYARAATGEDKIDRAALPEVMQVKKFGFANQNSRYKGLAKEDTTDKSQSFLPLVHKK